MEPSRRSSSESDTFTLVHIPSLSTTIRSVDVANNLLVHNVPDSLSMFNLHANALVFSGDLVNTNEKTAFVQANQVITKLSQVTNCESVLCIPGEADLIIPEHDDLIIRGLRKEGLEGLNAEKIDAVSQNESSFFLANPIRNLDGVESEFLPRATIYGPLFQQNVQILALDGSLFATGRETDRGELILGGSQLLEFLDSHLTAPMVICVTHYHPSWLAASQREIIELISQRAQFWLYGHAGSVSGTYISGSKTLLVGPFTQSREYQILSVNLGNRQSYIYSFAWDNQRSNWTFHGYDTRYVNLDAKIAEYPESYSISARHATTPAIAPVTTQSNLTEPKPDIAILTILPEEYRAVCELIPSLKILPGRKSDPNIYAWKTGQVSCTRLGGKYSLAVGMIGRPGTSKGALATSEAINRWHPRYIFFVGIAGGFGGIRRGDIVVADTIYGYEYGSLDDTFEPRQNWRFTTDQGLWNGILAYAGSTSWQTFLVNKLPLQLRPDVYPGEVASGDKVVDNPSNEFFKQVLAKIPKIKAIEMEGAGAGEAIEQAHAKGESVGFMMIRGISDLPRRLDVMASETEERGSKERDKWKPLASLSAAALTIGWIQDGLPISPSQED